MTKRKAGTKRRGEPNLREQRTASEFDREFVVDTFGPLTAEDRERWARAKKKPGRPRQGLGVKVISVSVERGLLARSDAAARKLGISRAELIARGLRAALASTGRGKRMTGFVRTGTG
jgi:hypothetical protein